MHLHIHRNSPTVHTSTLKVEAEYTKETSPTSTRCNHSRTELRQLVTVIFVMSQFSKETFYFVDVIQKKRRRAVVSYSSTLRHIDPDVQLHTV
jgi:hypothetical protein